MPILNFSPRLQSVQHLSLHCRVRELLVLAFPDAVFDELARGVFLRLQSLHIQ